MGIAFIVEAHPRAPKPLWPAADEGAAHGATPAQVALAWLLQRSPATIVIPGTSSIQHLEVNVAAPALRLEAPEMDALSRAAAPS